MDILDLKESFLNINHIDPCKQEFLEDLKVQSLYHHPKHQEELDLDLRQKKHGQNMLDDELKYEEQNTGSEQAQDNDNVQNREEHHLTYKKFLKNLKSIDDIIGDLQIWWNMRI